MTDQRLAAKVPRSFFLVSLMSAPLPLKFRVEDVPPEGRAVAGELPESLLIQPLAGLVGDLGYRADGSAKVEGTMYRTSSGEVVVDVGIGLRVGFDCVRCLSPRTLALSFRQDHVFTKAKAKDETHRTLDDESLTEPDVHTIEGDELDLVPVLQEDILLELPMNPSCKLLEPTTSCGELVIDQDESSNVDPRWAPLLDLKKTLN